MKKWWIILLAGCCGLAACEDVIEVETPSEAPRLVVDGLIRVDTTQPYIPVEIRLTRTSNFFGEISPVTDAREVVIIYQILEDGVPTGETFTSSLTQVEPGSGSYVPDPSFDTDQRIPTSILEHEVLFTLALEWDARRYAAQTRYVPSVPIDALRLGEDTLFEGDETEVIVSFTDQPGVDNYYLFDFGFGNYLPSEDTFYKGQAFEFSYFYDEAFEPGTILEVSLLGADLTFYNYMALLVDQTEGQQGPFQTPVATARGNVFDVTGLDNEGLTDNAGRADRFPLGYFAIVQEFKASITVE